MYNMQHKQAYMLLISLHEISNIYAENQDNYWDIFLQKSPDSNPKRSRALSVLTCFPPSLYATVSFSSRVVDEGHSLIVIWLKVRLMQAGRLLPTTAPGQQLYKITILNRTHDCRHKNSISPLMWRKLFCQHLLVIFYWTASSSCFPVCTQSGLDICDMLKTLKTVKRQHKLLTHTPLLDISIFFRS